MNNKFKTFSKMFPLVNIIEYSDETIELEKKKQTTERKQEAISWFKKKYPLMLALACIVQGWFGYFTYSQLPIEVTEILHPNYLIGAVLLCSSLSAAMFCPVSKWYKNISTMEAEFNIRAALCRPQLKNASDELTMQIFNYCNTHVIKN